jgi:hypothetical protein
MSFRWSSSIGSEMVFESVEVAFGCIEVELHRAIPLTKQQCCPGSRKRPRGKTGQYPPPVPSPWYRAVKGARLVAEPGD